MLSNETFLSDFQRLCGHLPNFWPSIFHSFLRLEKIWRHQSSDFPLHFGTDAYRISTFEHQNRYDLQILHHERDFFFSISHEWKRFSLLLDGLQDIQAWGVGGNRMIELLLKRTFQILSSKPFRSTGCGLCSGPYFTAGPKHNLHPVASSRCLGRLLNKHVWPKFFITLRFVRW